MFRIAPTALLAAALCTVATAQSKVDGSLAPDTKQATPPAAAKPLQFAGLAYLELTALPGGFEAYVEGASANYFGIVLLSLSPQQTHFLTGLPPILSEFVVLGGGFAIDQELRFRAPSPLPKELGTVYGQAVLLDQHGLWASGLVEVERKKEAAPLPAATH